MSRADARINLILDAIVDDLAAIDGDPATWLTKPANVVRWMPNPISGPMPLLVVRCARWGPNEPQTGRQHDAQAVIEVDCYVKYGGRGTDDPSRELHRMCADVISAIEADWQLSAAGVPSLAIHVIEGYEPAVANTAAGSGLAMATVGFRAFWPWVAATP